MPPRRRNSNGTSSTTVIPTDELVRRINEGIRTTANRPNLYSYVPHAKQEMFHKATKHTRLYIGGNRSGKSTGGVVEDIFRAMGRHPFQQVAPAPTRGRVCCVDFKQGLDQILLPEFKRWLPPSFLINGSWEDSYNGVAHLLTLANGSFIEFMSYEQDLEKFAGTSRHYVHYDEEPPKHIYNECQARLIDTDGYGYITMTPVQGMTWVHDDIYKPGIEHTDPDIYVIEIDMLENPHISPESAERYLKTLSPAERKAREHGTFELVGGKVFKEFAKATHVVPKTIPPTNWSWYVSIDHGFNNPTAMLWHAVSPYNEVITFSEHYASEMTVAEHAAVFHARTIMLGRAPDLIVGDPAMNQRGGITGTSIIQEYAEHGVYIMTEGIPRDVAVGINKMTQYLKLDRHNKALWNITEECPNLIRELELLHFEPFDSNKTAYKKNKKETIAKKNDHACDSTRYFFTCVPDLTPELRLFGRADSTTGSCYECPRSSTEHGIRC